MKNKLFSRGIYTEGLRRLRVFGLILAAVGLLAEIAPPMVIKMENTRYAVNSLTGSYTPEASGFFATCYALPAIVLLVVPLMTLVLFSSFNKRAYCDFCHSLPYTRSCIFISNVAAVMTWVLGLMVLCGASGILIRLAMPELFALSFTGYGMYILTEILTALYVCFTVTLAASLTGTVFSNITLAALIFSFPRIMVWIVTQQINENVPLLCGNLYTPILSPRYNPVVALFYNTFDSDRTLNDWGPIIYAAVICVLYAGLSLFFFNRRKSEMAGQSAPGRITQAVVRIALTMIPAAFGTVLILNDEVSLGVVMYILALIVYFAYEILSTLKWRNLLRSLPAVAAVVVLNFVLVGVIFAGTYFAKSYRPDADSVDSVRIVDITNNYNSKNYPDNAISKVKITDKSVIELVTTTLKNNLEYYEKRGYLPNVDPDDYENFKNVTSSAYPDRYVHNYEANFTEITVAFKEGAVTRYRKIILTEDEFNIITEHLSKNENYRSAVMTLPEPVSGTFGIYGIDTDFEDQEELEEILEALQEEIFDVGFEKWYTRLVFGATGGYSDSITMYYSADASGTYEVNLTVTADEFPETFKKICEFSWNKATGDKELMEAVESLPDGSESESEYWYWSIYAYAKDGSGEEAKNLWMYTYNATPDDQYYTEYVGNTETLIKLIDDAMINDAEFSTDSVVYFEMNVETEEDSYYRCFYVPVPEDFDFEAAGFVDQDDDMYYKE